MFLRPPPPQLLAGDLVLDRMVAADWPVEVALSRAPDVPRWTLYPPDLDEDSARRRIARGTDQEDVAVRYVVRRDGEGVGTAGLTTRRRADPEVFYALVPGARGRGIATAAVRALTDWAHTAGHGLVLLLTLPGNGPSEAVARRAGFVLACPETAEDGTVLHRWQHRPDGQATGSGSA